MPRFAGARWVTSTADLLRHGTDLDAWVLKAPHSVAGRDRILGWQVEGPSALRNRGGAFLERHGCALLEPWVNRTRDASAWGIVTDDGVYVGGWHRLTIDGGGSVDAIRRAEAGDPLGDTLLAALPDVGAALHEADYRGPFGVDGYAWEDADGREQLQAVGEINARMSFSMVAGALLEVAGPPWACLHLGIGAEDPPRADRLSLLGSPDQPISWAWLGCDA